MIQGYVIGIMFGLLLGYGLGRLAEARSQRRRSTFTGTISGPTMTSNLFETTITQPDGQPSRHQS